MPQPLVLLLPVVLKAPRVSRFLGPLVRQIIAHEVERIAGTLRLTVGAVGFRLVEDVIGMD